MTDFSSDVLKSKTFMNNIERVNFYQPEVFHDRVLIVEDKKFYVQSGILSFTSIYFRTLFITNLAEEDEREIPLPDVSAECFEYFLRIIYPGYFSLQSHLIEPSILLELVSLSFRFLCPIVLSEAKTAIIMSFGYSAKQCDLIALINLVLLYDLEDLKETIKNSLQDPEFVAEKHEEIMNAPEQIRNFVLSALLEEKRETNRENNRKRKHAVSRSSSRSSVSSRSPSRSP